jgi:tRNA-specific 2-thiouridylase
VICPARAAGKDQSYVLFRLPRRWLSRILFPLGDTESKQAVRKIAGGLGLEVHDKPDSQDVCFVPDGNYTSLLEARGSRALRPGAIVDSHGCVVGKHNGYGRFTIGQRRGTGVAMGRPAYVIGIDPRTATVTLGSREELLAGGLAAHGANWQVDVPPSFEATVKIRYNHRGAPARVTLTGDDTFEVRFRNPLEAVTPGQGAVVYSDDCLLGGGWIQDKLQVE